MTRRLKALVGTALFGAALMSTPVDARQSGYIHTGRDQHAVGYSGYSVQPGHVWIKIKLTKKSKARKAWKAKRKVAKAIKPRRHAAAQSVTWGRQAGTQILPHPPGCPPRAFCGCGVSLRLLGKPVRAGGLAIADNWKGFPRSACAPGMAAARRGHVFAIEECLPGNRAMAYDPNSGRGLTRLHVRSLAGYQIVNPHGAYTQVNGKPGRGYRTYRAIRYAKRVKRHRYANAG